MTPVWLVLEEVVFYQEQMIDLYGGLGGSPRVGALASTLARPEHLLAYEPDSSLYQLAAAYGYGVARNHCFPDSNKRTAWMVMATFLGSNGVELDANDADALAMILALAAGDLTEDALASWLEANSAVMPSVTDT